MDKAHIARTYCNPLPLPNYQRGRFCIQKEIDYGWHNKERRDFREMADPTVIKFKDRWYLFPSAGLLWYSDDMVNWTYHPIEPFDPGYAPTVVQKGEYLYLTANCDRIWRTKDPLGGWEDLGQIKDENGDPITWYDPVLFLDDDGTMYCYHGSGIDGIYVCRLKNDDITCWNGPKVHCFAFNPDHIWERSGEYNQNPNKSFLEGAWITKHDGRYYLQYSGPGTEFKNYAIGCYVSDHPMGPWQYQKRNPILIHKGGFVNGCGHHSIVEGPDGNLWCFYTTLVRIEHKFERRIGMDPAGFDENGELFVAGPSETPQLAPGIRPDPQNGNDAGLLPLSVNQDVQASSFVSGHEPQLAVDDNIRSWWEADQQDEQPWLLVDLGGEFNISSARILWADRGLDYDAGIVPGPYKYQIEASMDGENWNVALDMSDNNLDKHIAYETWDGCAAKYVRLRVLSFPKGMRLGVWEFTVFGEPVSG